MIRGRHPDARYFSFHIYDEALRPIDSVADFETTPDGDGGYTTGFTFEAPQSGALMYRVYVSDVPGDPAGGVPLPDISLKVCGPRGGAPARPVRTAATVRGRLAERRNQAARTTRRRRRGGSTSP